MTPALFLPNVDEGFDLFLDTVVGRADDLYHLDGETAFRRRGRTIETFDIDLDATTGGRP